MKLLSTLAVLSAALLLSACENPNGANGSASGSGAGGANGGYGANGNVTPGTQADLEANVGDRVFFGYDSSAIEGEGQGTLEKQAAWLKQYSNVNVTIEGHADERGTREYNLALGERRAAAAKRYLTGLGIAASRINVVSYGKERPAQVGSDDASWAQNRRAVTVVAN